MKTTNLTYTEAAEAISCNLFVKLPEWTGYWFRDANGKTVVKLANGDISDEPYTNDYKNRTDWFVTDGSRDFGGALKALKADKMLQRKGWNGKGMFLVYVDESSSVTINGYTILSWIGIKTVDDKIVPWVASQADMLAEDWFIVE